MTFLERILLSLLFPQFNSPINSRFESLFVSTIKKEKPINKKQNNNSKNIFPEKIVRNDDKRTSIIIKGIPTNMPKKVFKNFLIKYGNINYLYLIKSPFDSERNTSIAFINVVNYKSIIPLYMNLRNLKFEKDGQIFNFQIMYSTAQGKEQLKEYLKKNQFFRN